MRPAGDRTSIGKVLPSGRDADDPVAFHEDGGTVVGEPRLESHRPWRPDWQSLDGRLQMRSKQEKCSTMAAQFGPPREGVFAGGLPYLALGHGEPLAYLPGGTPNHHNPPPGFQRQLTLRTVRPFARAGFEVFFINRWPGMSIDVTWPEVAAVHAAALAEHFGRPVDVLGHSTGGSIVMQLIADHPGVVRRAVAASAAYTLGPVARRAQLNMLRSLETTAGSPPRNSLTGWCIAAG